MLYPHNLSGSTQGTLSALAFQPCFMWRKKLLPSCRKATSSTPEKVCPGLKSIEPLFCAKHRTQPLLRVHCCVCSSYEHRTKLQLKTRRRSWTRPGRAGNWWHQDSVLSRLTGRQTPAHAAVFCLSKFCERGALFDFKETNDLKRFAPAPDFCANLCIMNCEQRGENPKFKEF